MHFYCQFINRDKALNELCWRDEEEEGKGAMAWLPAPSLKRDLVVSAITAAHARDSAEFSVPQVSLLFFF